VGLHHRPLPLRSFALSSQTTPPTPPPPPQSFRGVRWIVRSSWLRSFRKKNSSETRSKTMGRVVLCESARAGVCVCSTHRCCAERRLLNAARETARRRGVRPWAFARWFRASFGALQVVRHTRDGAVATSLPCVLCRRALEAAGARWTAVTRDGAYVTDRDAPPSELTARQRATWNAKK
jgi:hypothetical protein